MTTSPGFSSRSTDHHTKQFPQRDEASMNEQDKAGWSNSEPVENAPQDVTVEVEPEEVLEPGYSNGKAVGGDAADVESKVVDEASAEDKSMKPAAKKTAAKKKG